MRRCKHTRLQEDVEKTSIRRLYMNIYADRSDGRSVDRLRISVDIYFLCGTGDQLQEPDVEQKHPTSKQHMAVSNGGY